MPQADNIEIGRRMRSRRKELKMTLYEVATQAGVAASTVQRYETGKFDRIKIPVIEAIASVLKVNPEWLSLHTDDPIDYDDGDLIAEIPLSYIEACDGDVAQAYAMQQAVYEENTSRIGRPYNPTHRIPILGRISAGLPLYAEQNIEGYMMTELNGGAEYFALRVTGDSMTAARIYDGDILVIRRQDEVENGQIAVVLVNGEDATVKKYYRTDTTISLVPHSLNPEHQMQVYDVSKTDVKVLGLVVQNVIKM